MSDYIEKAKTIEDEAAAYQFVESLNGDVKASDWPQIKTVLSKIKNVTKTDLETVYRESRPKPTPDPEPIAAPKPASLLLDAGANDYGNALCVIDDYDGQMGWCRPWGWLMYTGTHWESEGAEQNVNAAITRTLIKRGKTVLDNYAALPDARTLLAATEPSARNKSNARAMVQDAVVVSTAEFDTDPNVLNTLSGVVDLRTGKLITHEASQRFTYCTPVAYDPKASSDLWLNQLAETIEDDEEILDYVQMAVGYTLTGHSREECLFWLHGPMRSGKGTFGQTLVAAMGEPLGTFANFDSFTSERNGGDQGFDLARLKASRAVFASESDRFKKLNAQKIKQITGNDPLTVAFKNRDQFTYRPQFKVWLMSNFAPNADVDDDAVWGRLRVIRFPNSYSGNENKYLKDELSKPMHLQGVLSWAVAGAVRWFASDFGLVTPAKVMQNTSNARTELDYLSQFLDEHGYTVNMGAYWYDEKRHYVTVSDLYFDYEDWCDGTGVKKLSKPLLVKNMRARWGVVSDRAYVDGTRSRILRGITKDTEPRNDEEMVIQAEIEELIDGFFDE